VPGPTADPEVRPRRRLEWSEGADGRVEVLRPKFGTGRVGRWISGRLANPFLAVRLDEVGSFVWKRCDGEHTVAEIARELAGRDPSPAPDLERRLAIFLDRMRARGLIDV
jgi:hypothetical protein